MADIGTLRLLFLAANLFFWFIGGGLLGFVGWTLSTLPSTSGFMSGSFLVFYAGIAIGVLIALAGLVGCLGGMFGSMLLLKVYLGLSMTFGMIEIILIIVVYTQKDQIPSILEATWNEVNDEARYTIQTGLKCCGIKSYSEYGSDYASFPDSCFKVSEMFGTVTAKRESTLYTISCLSAIQTWLTDNMAIWIAVLVGIALVQIVSGMLSCQVFTRLHEKVRVRPMMGEDPNELNLAGSKSKQEELNDLDLTENERNIDGASCNSTSTIEQEEGHNRKNAGIVAVVNLESNDNLEDSMSEKDINDKEFEFKSEPQLNADDLEKSLHFAEKNADSDDENVQEQKLYTESTKELCPPPVVSKDEASRSRSVITNDSNDDPSRDKTIDNNENSSVRSESVSSYKHMSDSRRQISVSDENNFEPEVKS
ncbi:CD82 antigen-like [Mytilus trossulus]|uniref:CD82 antigen-like n=1 Tax=Mytilus trossulus TaxID=6551 RepID=UPI003006D0E7